MPCPPPPFSPILDPSSHPDSLVTTKSVLASKLFKKRPRALSWWQSRWKTSFPAIQGLTTEHFLFFRQRFSKRGPRTNNIRITWKLGLPNLPSRWGPTISIFTRPPGDSEARHSSGRKTREDGKKIRTEAHQRIWEMEGWEVEKKEITKEEPTK